MENKKGIMRLPSDSFRLVPKRANRELDEQMRLEFLSFMAHDLGKPLKHVKKKLSNEEKHEYLMSFKLYDRIKAQHQYDSPRPFTKMKTVKTQQIRQNLVNLHQEHNPLDGGMTYDAKQRLFVYEVISSEDEEESQYKAKQTAIFPYAANVHRAARNNYFKNCHGAAIKPVVKTHSNIALQEAQALAELDGLLSDDDLEESLSSSSSD